MSTTEFLGRGAKRWVSVAAAGLFVTGVAAGTAQADVAPAQIAKTAPAAPANLPGSTQAPGAQQAPAAQTPAAATSAYVLPTWALTPGVLHLAAVPFLAFGAPLPGYSINSSFGMRELSFEGGRKVHEGVDIAAPQGSPIHVTADGQVVRAGRSPSYGNFVEVQHPGGVTSFYAHMSKTAGMAVGEQVKEGDVIGYVGSTGHSTGPHLHFEIRKDGDHFDPQMFMGHAFQTMASLPLVRSAEDMFGDFKNRVYRVAYHTRLRSRHRVTYASHNVRGRRVYARNSHGGRNVRYGG